MNKIPKSFKLATLSWTVDKTSTILYGSSSDRYTLGRTILGECRIVLSKKGRTTSYDKDNKEQIRNFNMKDELIENTFYHELVHAMLDTMGSDKSDDEQFVQSLGNLLMEYDNTKEYE